MQVDDCDRRHQQTHAKNADWDLLVHALADACPSLSRLAVRFLMTEDWSPWLGGRPMFGCWATIARRLPGLRRIEVTTTLDLRGPYGMFEADRDDGDPSSSTSTSTSYALPASLETFVLGGAAPPRGLFARLVDSRSLREVALDWLPEASPAIPGCSWERLVLRYPPGVREVNVFAGALPPLVVAEVEPGMRWRWMFGPDSPGVDEARAAATKVAAAMSPSAKSAKITMVLALSAGYGRYSHRFMTEVIDALAPLAGFVDRIQFAGPWRIDRALLAGAAAALPRATGLTVAHSSVVLLPDAWFHLASRECILQRLEFSVYVPLPELVSLAVSVARPGVTIVWKPLDESPAWSAFVASLAARREALGAPPLTVENWPAGLATDP